MHKQSSNFCLRFKLTHYHLAGSIDKLIQNKYDPAQVMKFLAALAFGLLGLFLNSQAVVYALSNSPKTPSKTVVQGGPSPEFVPPFYTSARLGTGNGNSALIMPPVLPSASFTFEAWVKLDPFTTTSNESRYILSQRSNVQYNYTGVTLWVYGNSNSNGGIIRAAVRDGRDIEVLIENVNRKVSTGVWHHIAFQRTANFVNVFLDGEPIAGKNYRGIAPFRSPGALVIGAYSNRYPGAADFKIEAGWKGEIEEVRVSRIARYTERFTPRRAPYNNDFDTLALWHLDWWPDDSSGFNRSGYPYGSVSFVQSTLEALPYPRVYSSYVYPCTSTSCGSVTTVEVGVDQLASNTVIEAVGAIDRQAYSELTYNNSGQAHAVIVNRYYNFLLIDFHDLPCDQTYYLRARNPQLPALSADVSIRGGEGDVFFRPRNYCPRG